MRLAGLISIAAAALAAGCGPNCQSTCERLYTESECNIQRAGRDVDWLLGECRTMCEDALKNPGEIGEYDPYTQSGYGSSVQLNNEQQAALWMQCVSEMDCEKIDEDNYCAPVP